MTLSFVRLWRSNWGSQIRDGRRPTPKRRRQRSLDSFELGSGVDPPFFVGSFVGIKALSEV